MTAAARRHAERRQIELDLAQVATPMPAGPFSVVLADPPWRFNLRSIETGGGRQPLYPTMTLEEIAAMSVPAARDAVLFLWATSPMTPQAFEVMAAWGFVYSTHMVWVKDKDGLGYRVRNRHELLLIGRRGRLRVPRVTKPSSVIEAPRGRHSEKPEAFQQLIERLYPGESKLELFARRTRPGWTCWGNEVTP